jgi:hypothetical protein
MVCVKTAPSPCPKCANPANHCTRLKKNLGANHQINRFILRGVLPVRNNDGPRERPGGAMKVAQDATTLDA